MMNLKQIAAEKEKAREEIKTRENNIKILGKEEEINAIFKAERFGAFKSDEYLKLQEEAKANAGKIDREKEEIEKLNIYIEILRENENAAAVAEVLPLIKEVTAKYNGKQYGPKTADKIHEEIKSRAGYSVHIYNNKITIDKYTAAGYTYGSQYIKEIYCKYQEPFITPDNTLNADRIQEAENKYTYTENPRTLAKTIYKKQEELKKALAKVEQIGGEYNAIVTRYNKYANTSYINRVLER